MKHLALKADATTSEQNDIWLLYQYACSHLQQEMRTRLLHAQARMREN